MSDTGSKSSGEHLSTTDSHNPTHSSEAVHIRVTDDDALSEAGKSTSSSTHAFGSPNPSEADDFDGDGKRIAKRRRHMVGDSSSTTPSRSYAPMSERQQLAYLKKIEKATGEPCSSPCSPTSSTPGRSGGRGRLQTIDRRNDRGETRLHVAARRGEHHRCRALLQQGATVDAYDNAGWTPLHEACNFGMYKAAKVLLQNGANVNATGLDNDTPLHDAASNNNSKVLKLLLKHGANPTMANKDGKVPLDLCTDQKCRKMLIDAIADREQQQLTLTSQASSCSSASSPESMLDHDRDSIGMHSPHASEHEFVHSSSVEAPSSAPPPERPKPKPRPKPPSPSQLEPPTEPPPAMRDLIKPTVLLPTTTTVAATTISAIVESASSTTSIGSTSASTSSTVITSNVPSIVVSSTSTTTTTTTSSAGAGGTPLSTTPLRRSARGKRLKSPPLSCCGGHSPGRAHGHTTATATTSGSTPQSGQSSPASSRSAPGSATGSLPSYALARRRREFLKSKRKHQQMVAGNGSPVKHQSASSTPSIARVTSGTGRRRGRPPRVGAQLAHPHHHGHHHQTQTNVKSGVGDTLDVNKDTTVVGVTSTTPTFDSKPKKSTATTDLSEVTPPGAEVFDFHDSDSDVESSSAERRKAQRPPKPKKPKVEPKSSEKIKTETNADLSAGIKLKVEVDSEKPAAVVSAVPPRDPTAPTILPSSPTSSSSSNFLTRKKRLLAGGPDVEPAASTCLSEPSSPTQTPVADIDDKQSLCGDITVVLNSEDDPKRVPPIKLTIGDEMTQTTDDTALEMKEEENDGNDDISNDTTSNDNNKERASKDARLTRSQLREQYRHIMDGTDTTATTQHSTLHISASAPGLNMMAANAAVMMHPHKRKFNKPKPMMATPAASAVSAGGGGQQTQGGTHWSQNVAIWNTESLLQKNSYEAHKGLRQLVERGWRDHAVRYNESLITNPPHLDTSGFMLKKKSYLLYERWKQEQAAAQQQPQPTTPTNISAADAAVREMLFEKHTEQRDALRLQQRVERQRLQMSIEKQLCRVYTRYAHGAQRPLSAMKIQRDQDVYNTLELDQPSILSPNSAPIAVTIAAQEAQVPLDKLIEKVVQRVKKQKNELLTRHRWECQCLCGTQQLQWQSAYRKACHLSVHDPCPQPDETLVPHVQPVDDILIHVDPAANAQTQQE